MNTKPDNASAAPKASEPAAGRPAPTMLPDWIRPISTLAPPATRTADVSAAYRPTTADASSSARPVSSSARVWRVTVKTTISPVSRARNPHMRQEMNPPAVVRSNGGP